MNKKRPFKRRRTGKTDYTKRLALLKSGKKRIVFRKSNKRVIMQLIEFHPKGDRTLLSVSSDQLKKFGWMGKCNIPTAYLSGYWLGKKALSKGVKEAVYDIGMHTPVHRGQAFAALEGLIEAGMDIPFNEKVFPSDEKIQGKHIQNYAKQLGSKKEKTFSEYLNQGFDPEKITESFEKTKNAIDESKSENTEKVKK